MSKVSKDTRKEGIKKLIIIIICTALIGIVLLSVYFISGTNKKITYKESNNIDYKVMLKDNDFYEDNYLDKDKGYIASIISSILITDYNYYMDFNNDVNYDYSYKLVAEIDVKDEKNDSNIYHFSEVLSEGKDIKAEGDINVNIKDLAVDFPKYNNIINKFKDIYELNNISSNLNVNLYIDVNSINGKETKNFKDKKVSSLIVPLTLNTVKIDTSKNINETKGIMELDNSNYQNWILLLGVLFLIICLIYIICLIIYIRKSRTAQMIYDKEIKSIMSNYDGYIQKISDTYDMGTSQVLKLESFNDILEIRDTLKQPILMLENDKKDGTFFIIPATNNIIYAYALRVVDIKAKMDGKEIPTYNITEIIAEDFKKKKKFNKKYIEDQITMTTAMPVVDEGNIVKETNSKEDLYQQLDKTTSFNVEKIREELKKKKKETKKKSDSKKS